jgi:hypothetical protein
MNKTASNKVRQKYVLKHVTIQLFLKGFAPLFNIYNLCIAMLLFNTAGC